MLEDDQIAVCRRYGATFQAADAAMIAGMSRNLRSGDLPIHGLRHLAEANTSGWFLWAGEYSEADDFFEPVHIGHLSEFCPTVLCYLGLSPGWRFLLAENYADVWFDVKLLGTGR
jgi:hypothetical protein